MGPTILAHISDVVPDMPWWEADFAPTPAFDEVRPLFDTARALGDRESWDEWEAVWREIRDRGVRLAVDGRDNEVAEFVLSVDGGRCRYRY
jgi:hypothetical protein